MCLVASGSQWKRVWVLKRLLDDGYYKHENITFLIFNSLRVALFELFTKSVRYLESRRARWRTSPVDCFAPVHYFTVIYTASHWEATSESQVCSGEVMWQLVGRAKSQEIFIQMEWEDLSLEKVDNLCTPLLTQ